MSDVAMEPYGRAMDAGLTYFVERVEIHRCFEAKLEAKYAHQDREVL